MATFPTSRLIPVIALFTSALAVGCATTSPAEDIERAAMQGIPTGFINKTMDVREEKRAYVVYVPREYDPNKQWPLILFLHGAGERGDDGLHQTEVGIGTAIRENADRFPAVVVMPQCPKNVWWNKAIPDIDMSLQLTLDEYNIDPSRIYLTGISMGGYATWMYGADNIDRFAALMPICGGGNPTDAQALAKRPIWTFHGAIDQAVDPEESRKMVEAVEEAGGEVQLTIYDEVGHNSWDNAYGDKKVIRWLLSQEK